MADDRVEVEVWVGFTEEQELVRIYLPPHYADYAGRRVIRPETEVLEQAEFTRAAIETILEQKNGWLTDPRHRMRSPGAGTVVRIPGNSKNRPDRIVFHVRLSNRREVWPVKKRIPGVVGAWKAFAGITTTRPELEDPRFTAKKEVYEEAGFISEGKILLPRDFKCQQFKSARRQISLDLLRWQKPGNLGPTFLPHAQSYMLRNIDINKGARVEIWDGDRVCSEFEAIVGFVPSDNHLELSFIAELKTEEPLTGIIVLAGPEPEEEFWEAISLPPDHDLLTARLARTLLDEELKKDPFAGWQGPAYRGIHVIIAS